MANSLVTSDLANVANAYPVGLKMAVLTGTTSATNIAVSGAATTDFIVAAIQLDQSVPTILDITAEASFTSAGNVQFSTTNTTGDKVLLIWWDKA